MQRTEPRVVNFTQSPNLASAVLGRKAIGREPRRAFCPDLRKETLSEISRIKSGPI